MIAFNGVVGSGIFALPAASAVHAGYFSPWVFLIAAVLIAAIALPFARAASFFKETGGPIVYTTHSFGPFVGFQTGWLLFMSRVAGLAASTNLLVTYASSLFSPLANASVRPFAVALIIAFYTWINYVGLRKSMSLLYALTALKLCPLLLLVFFGLPSAQIAPVINADVPSLDNLGQSTLIVMYAFIGFEVAVITAGESKNPKSDIPVALLLTVALVSIFYVLIQVVAISVEPNLASSDRPLADVARRLFGPAGAAILAIGAVFSIAGSSATSMLVGPRMTFAMSEQHTLPNWFGAVHPKFGTPGNSILFCGIMGALLAVSGGFVWLATVSTLVRFLTYALTIAALPKIERTLPNEAGQFAIPGGLVIPGLGFFICLWLVAQASLAAWLAAGVLTLIGAALYVAGRRIRERVADD